MDSHLSKTLEAFGELYGLYFSKALLSLSELSTTLEAFGRCQQLLKLLGVISTPLVKSCWSLWELYELFLSKAPATSRSGTDSVLILIKAWCSLAFGQVAVWTVCVVHASLFPSSPPVHLAILHTTACSLQSFSFLPPASTKSLSIRQSRFQELSSILLYRTSLLIQPLPSTGNSCQGISLSLSHPNSSWGLFP